MRAPTQSIPNGRLSHLACAFFTNNFSPTNDSILNEFRTALSMKANFSRPRRGRLRSKQVSRGKTLQPSKDAFRQHFSPLLNSSTVLLTLSMVAEAGRPALVLPLATGPPGADAMEMSWLLPLQEVRSRRMEPLRETVSMGWKKVFFIYIELEKVVDSI